MKKLLIPFIITISMNYSFGQKNEIVISLNSGLFSFSGNSAKSVSAINYDIKNNSGYTNSPWGSQNGLCYGLSVNAKRVTKKNLIFGIDLGYENLRSKISIDRVNAYAAVGQTFLNNNFINLHPYIGYRIKFNKVSFDLTGGLEGAWRLSAYDKGSAVAENGTTYSISRDRNEDIFDIRQRVQLSSNFDKFGIYIGYSNGLYNYLSGYVCGGSSGGYARLIRFGLTYKLK
jgi:hypothetical protein